MSLTKKIDSLLSFVNSVPSQDTNETKCDEVPPDGLTNLNTFKIEEDLVQTEDFLAFKGNFGNPEEPSILKVRPSKPKVSELKKLINEIELSPAGKFGKGFGFYKAKCITTKSFNVDVIHPWVIPDDDENEEEKKQRLVDQQKIFDKFYKRCLPKKRFMVRETAEMYNKITLPYVQSIPIRAIKWVYDILDGARETNRIIVDNTHQEHGFVVALDSKWKSHPDVDKVPKSAWKLHHSVPTSFYVLGLVRDRTIKSLRDLRGKHIKVLENMLNKTLKVIKHLYGLDKNELRIFVHYHPQYWHFHVHFTCLAIDHGIHSGKAVLLEDIIDNLKQDPNYYEKASLSCLVYEGDPLLE